MGSLFDFISLGGIKPNLFIILIASAAFIRGENEGMAVGAITGVLADIMWGSLFGYHILIYTLIGFVCGIFNRIFFDDDIKFPILLIGVSDFGYGIVTYVFFHMFNGDFGLNYYMFHIIFPETVYTLLVTLIMYPIIRKLSIWVGRKEQRRSSTFV
jgi:rod shape-determining protein MreD